MSVRRREFLLTTGLGALGAACSTASGNVARATSFKLTVRGGFVLLMGPQVDLVTIKKPAQEPCEWMQHMMLLDTSGLKVTKAGIVRDLTIPPKPGFPALKCWDFTKANVTLTDVQGNTVTQAPSAETTCPPINWNNLIHVPDLATLSNGGTLHPQWPTKVESRLTVPAGAHAIAEPPNEFAKKGHWQFAADKKWPSSDNNEFIMPLRGTKLTMNVRYDNGDSGTLTLEASFGELPLIGATLMAADVRQPKCFATAEKINHFAMYYELLATPPACAQRLVPAYYPCDGVRVPTCQGYSTPGDYCPPGRLKK